MNSFSMKALAVAVLGLAGSSMAMATCPTMAAGNINDTGNAGGGAWSGQTQTQGTLAIVSPGYNATACGMTSALATGATAFAQATVDDNSPASPGEPSYRSRFYVNVDNITGLGSFDGAQIFSANAANAAPATNPTKQILKLAIVGAGSNKNLTVIAACANGTSNKCSSSTPLTAGVNVIETQVVIGAAGTAAVNYWVNNSNSATPTGSVTVTGGNAAWVGVKKAILGLASPTRNYGNGGVTAGFDEFDSRRQTFIGP